MQHTLTRLWARYRTFFKIAFFALLALGLYLGMRPTPAPASYSWQATLYHMAGLFALTLLSFPAFPRWYWWIRGLLMFSMGVAIEYVQSFHPTRSAEWADILANSSGIVAALLFAGICTFLSRRLGARS